MSKDHHSDGQKDYKEGKYNPPHTDTPLDEVVYDKHTLDKIHKDNREYDAGYKNARKNR